MPNITLTKLTEGNILSVAKENYSDIWNNIMSRGKTRKNYTFLGTKFKYANKNNLDTIVSNNYKFTSLPEGQRFLMMVGQKNNQNLRNIVFIDELLQFWIITIDKKQLPGIPNTPQLLFDGFLQIQGDTKYTLNEIFISGKVSLTYICTDMLYGPTNPIFKEESARRTLELGSSGAWMGPKGGSRWLLDKRYHTMKLILTNVYSVLNVYNRVGFYRNIFCFVLGYPLLDFNDWMSRGEKLEMVMKQLMQQAMDRQFSSLNIKPRTIKHKGILMITNGQYQYQTHCNRPNMVWKKKWDIVLRVGKKVQSNFDGIFMWEGVDSGGKVVGYLLGDDVGYGGEVVECVLGEGGGDGDMEEFDIMRVSRMLNIDSEEKVDQIIRVEDNPLSMSLMYKYWIVLQKGDVGSVRKFMKRVKTTKTKKLRCMVRQRPEVLFSYDTLIRINRMIYQCQLVKRNRLECNMVFNKSVLSCLLAVYVHTDPVMISQKMTIGKGGTLLNENVVMGGVTVLGNVVVRRELGSVYLDGGSDMMVKLKYKNLDVVDFQMYTQKQIQPTKSTRYNMYRWGARYDVPVYPDGNMSGVLWGMELYEYGESRKGLEEAKEKYGRGETGTEVKLRYVPGEREMEDWMYFVDTQDDNSSEENMRYLDYMVFKYNLRVEPYPGLVKRALDVRLERVRGYKSVNVLKEVCRLIEDVMRMIN